MRNIIRIAALGASMFFACLSAGAQTDATRAATAQPAVRRVVPRSGTDGRPNLIVLIADQWRGQALHFKGLEKVLTPNLDKLASGGVVVERMASNYPVCSPARAMLMTGMYPLRNGVDGNCTSETAPFHCELRSADTCWSDILHGRHYQTAYIGKWHLDSPHPPYIPTSNNKPPVKWNEWTEPARRHGFVYWYAYGTYEEHLRPMYWSTDAPRDSFQYVDQWGPIHEVDKAIEYLDARKGTAPFAMVVSMNPPHTAYNLVPQKYKDLYKDVPLDSLVTDPDIPAAGTPMGDAYRRDVKDYYACMSGVDEQIGRLLAYLEKTDRDNNTIILFISDHGNCLGKHDQPTKNNFYEESVSVPFILQWKGHLRPHLDKELLMSYPDIYPTLLGLMHLHADIPAGVQGVDYSGRLSGKARRGSGPPLPDAQYLIGDLAPGKEASGFRGIRTHRYKLAVQYDAKAKTVRHYLFDLQRDPYELDNIYTEDPEKVVPALQQKLMTWLRAQGDSFAEIPGVI